MQRTTTGAVRRILGALLGRHTNPAQPAEHHAAKGRRGGVRQRFFALRQLRSMGSEQVRVAQRFAASARVGQPT